MNLDDLFKQDGDKLENALKAIKQMDKNELDTLMSDVTGKKTSWNDKELHQIQKAYLRRSLELK